VRRGRADRWFVHSLGRFPRQTQVSTAMMPRLVIVRVTEQLQRGWAQMSLRLVSSGWAPIQLGDIRG
jgi:hypothetical protein